MVGQQSITNAIHVHLGLIRNGLGSCFTHSFSLGPWTAFAALRPWISTSTLGRHRKWSHQQDANRDATQTVTPGCPSFPLHTALKILCPGWPCLGQVLPLYFGKPGDHQHTRFIPSGLNALLYFQHIWLFFLLWVLHRDSN